MFRPILLTLLCGLLAAQQQRHRTRRIPSQPATIFRGGVEVVQAPVLVFDRDGNYVNGLQPFQFHLYDNGKEQNINVDVTYQPISLVIVLQANAHVDGILPQVKKIGGPDRAAADRRAGRGGRDRLRFANSHPAGLHVRQRKDYQGDQRSDRGQQFQPHDRRRRRQPRECSVPGPPTAGASSSTSARRAISRAKRGSAKH